MNHDNDATRQHSWGSNELREIAGTDEILVQPDGDEGQTPRATRIWCVAANDELYVRAYHGTRSRWYQAAVRQRAGQIVAAGRTWNVTFEPIDGSINARIDDAYRLKYRSSAYLGAMTGADARSATLKVGLREPHCAT